MAMTLEKLKKLLADKVIDEADYREMLEKYGLKDESDEDPLSGLDEKTKAAIQKMIQSERDRTANRLGNEKKTELEALQKQLDELKKTKLTEDERAKLEQEQKQQELEKERREFALLRNKYTAAQKLQAAGFDSSEDVVDLVIGKDTDATEKNVRALQDLVNKLVKAEVEKRFKDSGREPGHGNGGTGGGSDNPWKAGSINYTKQMEIEATDPDRAKLLKAAAGVK